LIAALGRKEKGMEQHLLLKLATRRKTSESPEMPENSQFNQTLGYWELPSGPLVKNSEFIRNHGTKKNDQETGEDQKGE
jgi:hypothetical protein